MVARHLITLDHRAAAGPRSGWAWVSRPAPTSATSATRPTPASEPPCSTRACRPRRLLRGPLSHQGDRYTVDSELLPRPVQRPAPASGWPAWLPTAGRSTRALRWDGLVPIAEGGLLTPDQVAAYLDGVDRPEGWDLVTNVAPGVPFEDYEAIGATWAVEEPGPSATGCATPATIDKGPQ